MKIKTFVFNSFQVNTYLIQNNSKEAIIIDPACYSEAEKDELKNYIKQEELTVKMALNTHAHIDHILGNSFIKKTFNCPLLAHKDSASYFTQAPSYASIFQLGASDIGEPDGELIEGEDIEFGELKLKILYTPGHADGSVCIYIPEEKTLFSGDVLFQGGIGRTDLPCGNHDLLLEIISSKLFSLPGETMVFPGHGPKTNIDEERKNNPFF